MGNAKALSESRLALRSATGEIARLRAELLLSQAPNGLGNDDVSFGILRTSGGWAAAKITASGVEWIGPKSNKGLPHGEKRIDAGMRAMNALSQEILRKT